MKTRPDLEELIHSLTRSEKRFFRIFATRHKDEGNQLLQYFDSLDLGREMPEFTADPGLLSVLRRQLWEALLQSLRNFSRTSSKMIHLREQVDHAELLFLRGMDAACRRTSSRARGKACAMEEWALALDLMKWEMRALRRQFAKGDAQLLQQLHEEEREILRQLTLASGIKALHDKAFTEAQQQGSRSQLEVATTLQTLRNDPLSLLSPADLPFQARLILHDTRLLIHQVAGDLDGMKEESEKMLALWDSSPEHKAAEPGRHLQAWLGYLQICFRIRDYSTLFRSIDELRALKPQDNKWAYRVFCSTHLLELLYTINQPAYSPREGLLSEVAEGVKRGEGEMDVQMRTLLLFNLGLCYLRGKEWKEGLACMHTLIGMGKDIREDTRSLAQQLLLVFQYEIGQTDVLEYSLRNIRRSIARNDVHGEALSLLVQLVSDLVRAVGEKEKMEIWKRTIPLIREGNEAGSKGFGELALWAAQYEE